MKKNILNIFKIKCSHVLTLGGPKLPVAQMTTNSLRSCNLSFSDIGILVMSHKSSSQEMGLGVMT